MLAAGSIREWVTCWERWSTATVGHLTNAPSESYLNSLKKSNFFSKCYNRIHNELLINHFKSIARLTITQSQKWKMAPPYTDQSLLNSTQLLLLLSYILFIRQSSSNRYYIPTNGLIELEFTANGRNLNDVIRDAFELSLRIGVVVVVSLTSSSVSPHGDIKQTQRVELLLDGCLAWSFV